MYAESDLVEIEIEEPKVPENDPTEYLPIMRHHLYEILWSLNMALGEVQARDLSDSYRQGLTVPKESPLARQLERSHTTLSTYLGLLDEEYLGLLDEEDEGGESVPEDE